MFRYNAVAAAILALSAACTDTVTSPGNAPASAPIDVATLDTATGRILALTAEDVGGAANALSPILMLTDMGDTLRLIGPVAEFLASGTVGVELWVAGSVQGDGAMEVVQYALRDGPVVFCDNPIREIKPERCAALSQLRKVSARAKR